MSEEDKFYEMLSNGLVQIKENYVGGSVLKDLLIEKGVFTREEFDQKYDEQYEAKSLAVANFIVNERGIK